MPSASAWRNRSNLPSVARAASLSGNSRIRSWPGRRKNSMRLGAVRQADAVRAGCPHRGSLGRSPHRVAGSRMCPCRRSRSRREACRPSPSTLILAPSMGSSSSGIVCPLPVDQRALHRPCPRRPGRRRCRLVRRLRRRRRHRRRRLGSGSPASDPSDVGGQQPAMIRSRTNAAAARRPAVPACAADLTGGSRYRRPADSHRSGLSLASASIGASSSGGIGLATR